MRGPTLDRLRGSAWLNGYFRALGATVGPRALLYPTRGDPMMTEPDLVEARAAARRPISRPVCSARPWTETGASRERERARERESEREVAGSVLGFRFL